MIYKLLIKNLLFSTDAESAHESTLNLLAKFGHLIPRKKINDSKGLSINVSGINFPNRIGLAAGMDKACVAPLAWQGLGFGFIEIGTVTNHSQPGNPKPRLFRIPEEKSLLNRLGFNNPGADALEIRLKQIKQKPKFEIPLGINIGKSKIIDSENREAVIEDYLECLKKVQSHADYVTINVSSPNTPGLREWQSPQQLNALLKPIKDAAQKPLFVKLSPDLDWQTLDCILEVISSLSIDGVIATNTTISRKGSPNWAKFETGGISGELLRSKSYEISEWIVKKKPKNMAFISVGGISSVDDVKKRLDLGANLVQIYTALVYRGPNLISCLNKALVSGSPL
ncbi:MAG: quinone-dependent dihydroorotate dehydrogenase [Candidatus Caenarcaniphilales bacterium]|nr:quinone-dependent dihydroorotate dehydrogenase [Candidatus Caenarcaniphilales bacterium]